MTLFRLGSNGPILRLPNGALLDDGTSSHIPPGTVDVLAASNIAATSLTLTWTAPAGTPPVTYAVMTKLHNAGSYTQYSSTTQNETINITGLTASTQYDFYVVGTNPYGTSAQGLVISPTTASSSPVIPGVATLAVPTMGTTTAALSWTAPTTGTTPFTYSYTYKLSSAGSFLTATSVGSATTANITGLTASSSYDFKVITQNSAGSTDSNIRTISTSAVSGVIPGVATLAVPTMGSTTAALSWTAPTTGTTPFSYSYTYKLTSAGSFPTATSVGTATTANITGLTASSSYDFKVITQNSAGSTDSNTRTASTTSAGNVNAPGPINLSSGTRTSTSIVLNWANPTGALPFTFTPSHRVRGVSSWTAHSTVTNSTTSSNTTTISGLTLGTIYEFKVDVTNGVSPGNTSNILTVTFYDPTLAPPTLSGITLTQPYPLHPLVGNGLQRVGWLDPIGGIGPFKYTTLSSTNNQFYTFVETDYNYSPLDASGVVNVTYDGSGTGDLGTGTSTITVRCTDHRGDHADATFTIAKTDGTADVFSMNRRNPNDNSTSVDHFSSGPLFTPTGQPPSRGYTTGDSVLINTTTGQPSTTFINSYSSIVSATQTIPAGNYPLTIGMVDGNGVSHPFSFIAQINQYQNPTYIEFIPQGVISTSTPAGLILGTAHCTTSHNKPVFSLVDADNPTDTTFQINAVTGIVSLQSTPSQVKTYNLNITVVDRMQTITTLFPISVVQGTVVPSTNMTLSPATLVNVGYNQVVGTPTVTGITGTKQWTLDYPDKLAQGLIDGVSYYYPDLTNIFTIDQHTGAITVPGLPHAKTFELTVACTDGVNTCTRTFDVVCNWAPTVRNIYCGRGFSTTLPAGAVSGAIGYETFNAALHAENGPQATAHTDGTRYYRLYADADPDYYANSGDGILYGVNGPAIVEGIPANGVKSPRLGDNVDKWVNVNASPILSTQVGDFKAINLEISHCLGDTYSGVSGFEKRGGTYGSVWIDSCYIHDCDQPIHIADTTLGEAFVTNCILARGGGNQLGSGRQHNIYAGVGNHLYIGNTISVGTMGSHLCKTRKYRVLIENSRFYYLESGHGVACIDACQGGLLEIRNCEFQQGPMGALGTAVQWCAEFDPTLAGYETCTMNVHDCVFACMTPPVIKQSSSQGVGVYTLYTSNGSPNTVTLTNNSYWLYPGANSLGEALFPGRTEPLSVTTETGKTILALPQALDLSDPRAAYAGQQMPSPGFYCHMSLWEDDWPNFDGYQSLPSKEELRISHTTAVGTVVCTFTAFGDYGTNPRGTPPGSQPFGPGTTWSFTNQSLWYGSIPLANSKYTITSESDGSATLKVGAALSTGVDYIYIQTQNGSAVSKMLYWVVVT